MAIYSAKPPLVSIRVRCQSVRKMLTEVLEKEAVWFTDCLTHLSSSIDVNNHNKKTLTCWNIEPNVQSSHICCATIGNCGLFREYIEENISRSLFPWMMIWWKENICIHIPVHLWRRLIVRQMCVNILKNIAQEKHWQRFLSMSTSVCSLHVTFIIWLMIHFLLINCQHKCTHTHTHTHTHNTHTSELTWGNQIKKM